MKTVYVAAPLSAPDYAGIHENRRRASRWVAWVVTTFRVAPIADWIIITENIDDSPANRALGLACDVELVSRADELWLVGGRVSEGMSVEAEAMRKLGRPVRDLTYLGQEPPGTLLRDGLDRLMQALGDPVAVVAEGAGYADSGPA